MIIQKTIITTLIIKHKEMAGDLKDLYKHKANELFVGKCFRGAYILEIIELEYSHLTMLLEEGHVNVILKCNVMIFQKDEIITGAIVRYRSKEGHTICMDKDNRYVASVIDTRDFNSLKTNQIIPLRVIDVSYAISKTEISITASINIISYDTIPKRYFEISLPKKVKNIDKFVSSIVRFNTELEKVSKFTDKQTKIYHKFQDILYPYKRKPKYNTKLVKSILEFKEGLLLKWDAMGRDNFDVLQLDKIIQSDKIQGEILGDDLCKGSHEAIESILTSKILHLILLREMSELYDDKQLKSHENIWIYYAKKLKN